jgi:hypothetical protein
MGVIDKDEIFTDEPRGLGQVPGHKPDQYAVSRAAEDEIEFGMALMEGTDDLDVKKYAGTSGVFVGVAAFSTEGSKENATTELIDGYEAGNPVGAVQQGLINVYATEAVSPSDPVRIVHTRAGDPTEVGKFAKTAVSAETTLLTGAKWAGTITAEGIVALDLGGVTEFATADDA